MSDQTAWVINNHKEGSSMKLKARDKVELWVAGNGQEVYDDNR